MQQSKRQFMSTALWCALAVGLSSPSFAHTKTMHGKKTPTLIEQKAWGIPGTAKKAKRRINVSMDDTMRFNPDHINANLGETIHFVIHNRGTNLHEFVIGTHEENAQHAALMIKFPNMEHDEPYMAHVPAGGQSEIIWTFNRPGRFEFACLIAGHYQSGMVGTITVHPAKPQ